MEREEKKTSVGGKKKRRKAAEARTICWVHTEHSEIQKAVNSTAEETQKMLLSNDVLTKMRERKVGMDAESLPFYFDFAGKNKGI